MERSDESRYSVLETLYADGGTILCRAIREHDRRPVVLKAIDPRRCPRGAMGRLRHEYDVASALEAGAIVRPLALDTFRGMPAIVLEDFRGRPLDRLLGAPLPIERFLELAVGIAAAIADIHRRGVVHKDLKPENILIDPDTLEVKIADFGMATQLPREQQPVQPPQIIEGSLPYVSPEQTGRMNRAVDSRSDLYSLGVTFFEMLTGRLPFDARDPLEWVHCHVAREAPSPAQIVPDVPDVVGRIVLRLLAKMADDRYQSAHGMRHDLERCLAAWRAHGRVDPFPLGERDALDRLQVPQKLYGREDDRAALLTTFERVVATGAPELLLVSGYSGVGKSSLVHELLRPLVRERGLFLEGKFDQRASNIPYSTIVQAFGELVMDILVEGEERRASWARAIRGALDGSARLLTDMIPPLRLLVGEAPPLPELSPTEVEQHVHQAFREFVRVFTRDGRPLVLFVDDLQWADPASLALLEAILTDPAMRHLLVVGAFRSNEVGPAHPLTQALERVRSARAVTEVALAPLRAEHVLELVADTVHARHEDARPLARIVHEKTEGNPLFVAQFLAALYDEGLLRFDEEQGSWRWDVARISEHGYADDVADLLARKIAALPSGARELLETAACVGNQAPLSILAPAHGLSEEEVLRLLQEAMAAGLVLRARDRYAFAHDRVQQAAYSLVSEERRAAMHLRIGRHLVERLPRERWDDWIFEIVTQLDLGQPLMVDPEERVRLAELNLRAGEKANSTAAYRSAIAYFAAGEGLLPQDGWESRYELTYALKLERARCEWLCGNLEAAARSLLELLARTRSRADRAAVYRVKIAVHITRGEIEEASRAALSACASLFGFDLPLHPTDAALREAASRTLADLGDRPVEDLLDLPAVTDPDLQAAVALLSASLPAAYQTDPNLHDLMCCHIVDLTLRHGTSAFSPHGYVTFGAALGRLFDDWERAFRFGAVACDLVDRRGIREGEASTYFTVPTFISFWVRHVREVIPFYRRARRAALEHGDANHACWAGEYVVIARMIAGDPLDAISAEIEAQLDLARQARYAEIESSLLSLRRSVLALRGLPAPGPGAPPEGERPGLFDMATEARAHLLLGDADGALRVVRAATARAETGAARGQPTEAEHAFVAAIVLAAHLDCAPPEERARDLAALAACEERLAAWTRHCPANFRGRRALASAELARLRGRDLEAMRLYEEAIAASRESGFVHDEAMGHERAASFYRARGFATIAAAYLREARGCYLRWGADAKVTDLDRSHLPAVERRPGAAHSSSRVRSEHLDVASVLKASQTISREIVLEDLTRTLLQVVLQEGGAQRACLLLCREGRLLVEAEATAVGAGVAAVLQAPAPEPASAVPLSVVDWVRRSNERVILDDATRPTRFSADPYFARRRPRSVLGLPITRRAEVVGVLYLENDLAAGAFTPDRLTALTVLASQAAISIENARLYREAQRAVRIRDEFLSIASHELRTPVATLNLTLQGLERAAAAGGGALDPRLVSRAMARAARQGERLNRLIHDLLDISRLESTGRLPLQLAEVDLARLARDVVEHLEPTLSAAGCTVDVRGEAGIVGRWDAARLEQVVTNLLSNAMKFGAGRPIEVEVRAREGTASLAVRDHGIGIDASAHARIFERFGRAVPALHYGGLGLGLFISRRIAEAHGGTVRVESEPGAGSTFTLEVPCSPDPR